MAIMVHFKDDTVCFVPDMDLAELILSDSIVAFRRGAEWINLSAAGIRRNTSVRNIGKEKKGVGARDRFWKRSLAVNVG